MRLINYEESESGRYQTTSCKHCLDNKVGSAQCMACKAFVCRDTDKQIVVCCHRIEREQERGNKDSKLKNLRTILPYLDHDGDLYVTLEQVIQIHDNPLGVLPNDTIICWNEHDQDKGRRIFDSYERGEENPWHTDGGFFKYAKCVRYIPKLDDDDVTFLWSIVLNPTIDEHDLATLEKLLTEGD